MSQPFRIPRSGLVKRLWQAQGGRCALCGKIMLRHRFEAPHARIWAKHRATLDHIVPRSRGGGNNEQNLQLTHARCNRIKGNRF